MKKILYTFLAFSLVLPMMASAATFSFSPSTGSYAPGDTFDVSVYVNPNSGESITTAKLSALFPNDKLEVISFAIESGWIPLTQSGYDLIDNTNGKVIKTGGYTAKIQSQTKFGVLTLKTKASGSASLNTTTDSMLLDITNINKYISSNGAVFTITVPTSKPKVISKTPKVTGTVTTPTNVQTQVNTKVENNKADDSLVVSDKGLVPQTAAAAAAEGSEGLGSVWIWILGIIVLIGVITYFKFYLPKKKK